MKSILNAAIILLSFHQINAQCSIYATERMKEHCTGVHLVHQELHNQGAENLKLILNKGSQYVLYLLNANQDVKNYALKCTNETIEMVSLLNKKNKVRKYFIQVDESKEYDFSIDFNSKKKACTLLAIYLQNSQKSPIGIYTSLEDMNSNRLIFADIKLVEKQNKKGLIYRFENKKETPLCYGITNGKDKFIRTPDNAFIKLEDLGKYYFYELCDPDGEMVLAVTGRADLAAAVDDDAFYVLHKKSGAIMELNKNTLRNLIKDKPKLLEAFDLEKKKRKVLKEYLIRYSN
jgi:hypothetical protein